MPLVSGSVKGIGKTSGPIPVNVEPPSSAFIVLETADARRNLHLTALLGDGVISPTGGGGGFEVVKRPGRRPLVAWRGPDDGYHVPVTMILDGLAGNTSVEADVRTLEVMAGVIVTSDPEPPQLIVKGAAFPHDHSRAPSFRWVIESSPTWGAGIRRNSDGDRVRQEVTISLLLVTNDDQLTAVPAARKPTYRFISAKSGDTFEKIAARELGSKRLGSKLARLNGKRSPDVKLKTRTKVKLPTGSTIDQWKADLKKGVA